MEETKKKEELIYQLAVTGTVRVALFPDGTWTPIIEGGNEGGNPTALETPPDPDTALNDGGDPPDPDAPIEVPDKFKNEDGTLNDQGLLKSYGELERTLGKQGKPPETVDGYEVESKFPEGVKVDEEGQKAFLGRCHEKGLTNDMVQFIMDEYGGIITEAVNVQAETREGTVEQLKELYGDKYGDKMISAMNAFKAAGIEGLDVKEVGNNPAMIQILAVLGENLTEDQLPDNMQFAGSGISEEEIQTMMRSKPYWDSKDPKHLEVKAKVQRHFQAKHAKKKK